MFVFITIKTIGRHRRPVACRDVMGIRLNGKDGGTRTELWPSTKMRVSCIIYRSIHTHTCTHIYTHIHAHIHAHTHIPVGDNSRYHEANACVYVSVRNVYVFVCVCIYVYMYIHTYTGSSRQVETTVFDPASVFLSTHWWSQQPSLPVLFL